MPKVKPTALLILVILTSSYVFAGSCKSDPKVVAACFNVRGRMYNANGGSIARIWKVGTKRTLGVINQELPLSIRPLMGNFEDVVFADFLVCPYTKVKPEHMQLVCVESASHIKHVPGSE